MASFDDILSSAKLPEDSVPICLRGDLQLRHDQLEEQLVEAEEADKENSLAAGGQARKIAAEIDALEAEMREHTHRFAFRALPSRQYRDLVEQHPPREGHKEDPIWGANTATFPHALIAACCIDPVMSEEQVEQLCEVLTDGQALTLFGCAWGVNRAPVDVPKSAAASEVLRRPAPRSKPPAPGASPGKGSSAGSLAG